MRYLNSMASDGSAIGGVSAPDGQTFPPTSDSAAASQQQDGSESAVSAPGVANFTDWQQRRGVFADMVDEAIASYDSWMLEDDYSAYGALNKIIGRLRERRAHLGEKT